MTLPRGTVTFLFTDIEGSTRLIHELGEAYGAALAAHHDILRRAITGNGGVEVHTEGDAFFAVFERVRDAVAAVTQAQRALAGTPTRVRMGMHTGEAEFIGDNYGGMAVHTAARIASAANGGQVLLSDATRALLDGTPTVDLGEFRLKDIPRPQRLAQLDLGEAPRAPRARSVTARLPIRRTSFVGREDAIVEVADLVAREPLVTLTGTGGVGKTRLAVEIAARVADNLSDGVAFIDLAPIAEDDHVVLAAADVLEVTPEPGRTIEEALWARVREGLLLVLDNCEHVTAGAARFAERAVDAGAHVLATSREALAIAGEVAWRVPSLDVQTEAARLFVERALVAEPSWSPVGDERAIESICRRLDGIPLAIELAAAKVAALDPSEIARRLDDRFTLLTGNARRGLERQQTLRAAIDWSHDLLDEPQRVLLRRLSVFVGGVPLEAIEAVGGEVLADLTALIAKSMVVRERVGSQARYRLLETIRQYAAEKLAAAGEAEIYRTKHLAWFAGLADQAFIEFSGPESANEPAWVEHVDSLIDNFRSALAWAAHLGAGREMLRLSVGLWHYWLFRGSLEEGRRWLEEAVRGGVDEPALRAEALMGLSKVYGWIDDREASLRSAQTALEQARGTGDEVLVARCKGAIAWCLYSRRQYEHARQSAEEAVAVLRGQHLHGELSAMVTLAGALCRMKEYEQARRILGAAEALLKPHDRRAKAAILDVFAIVRLETGDPAGAADAHMEVQAIYAELGWATGQARQLLFASRAYGRLGDFERAIDASDRAAGLLPNDPFTGPAAILLQGNYRISAGRPSEALEFFQKISDESFWGHGHWYRLVMSADAFVSMGALERAMRMLADLPARHPPSDLGSARSDMVSVAARFAWAVGERHDAVRLLGMADALLPSGYPDPSRVHLAEDARAQLGDEEFEALHQAGAELSFEEARALVRKILERFDG